MTYELRDQVTKVAENKTKLLRINIEQMLSTDKKERFIQKEINSLKELLTDEEKQIEELAP